MHERDYLLSEVCMSVHCTELFPVCESQPVGRSREQGDPYGGLGISKDVALDAGSSTAIQLSVLGAKNSVAGAANDAKGQRTNPLSREDADGSVGVARPPQ